MSRYTGPRLRKMRALECDLPGLSPKSIWGGRPYPPGQHGNQRRRKISDYKVVDRPVPDSAPMPVEVQRVVEWYSRR